MNINNKLNFSSDYMEGAHPAIIRRLVETNMAQTAGYGLDEFSESARNKIRIECSSPDADVFFLVGGTQANAVVIDAILKPYQGVLAANTGHISTHEAGAIECSGHKVFTVYSEDGKISADQISQYCGNYWSDANHEHMVMPGMVYISQPTEYGTIYSLAELTEISKVCRQYNMSLYLDGARLTYALACDKNDVYLKDIARLCDALYIGGTKCGALFGEAVVFPKHDYVPHFFTIIKQHGALLAKGRITGIQFDTLFTDNLYFKIGKSTIEAADDIRKALLEKGYHLSFNSPTNQIFVTLDNDQLNRITSKVELGFWEKIDDDHTVMRIATSWATQPDAVKALIQIL